MKKLLTIFAAAAALVACSKTAPVQLPEGDPARPVSFTVSNIMTLDTKAEAVPIAGGKYVAVYAGAPVSTENVKMTVTMEANATSGTLAPTSPNTLLWAVGQTTTASNFLAVYPHEDSRPLVKPGETPEEQATESNWYIDYSISGADDVTYADIFLSAAASQAPGTGEEPAKVALEFKHPFVKLVYNIENTSDDFVSEVKISGIHRNGHLMFTTGAVATSGDAVAANAPIALNANGENSWMTIAMPESSAINPVVTVIMGSGAEYVFQLATATTLAAGKVYSAAIAISGSHEVDESDRTVYGTFSVTDWDPVDAGSLTAGAATPAAKWWYIVGNIDAADAETPTNTNWDKYFPFKCIGPDTWQVDIYYAGTSDKNSNGFKFMHTAPANVPDWSTANAVWGMGSGSNWWSMASDTIFAQGDTEHDAHHVHDMASPGNNMAIDVKEGDSHKYRIVFTPSSNEYYIYKLAE